MISFDAELRALAKRLDLPEPARSRTLLELRADLEDMAAALGDRGVDEDEARARALEALLPDAAALAALRGVHRSLPDRIVDRFSPRGRHRLERALLFLVAAGGLGGSLWLLAGLDLLADPSPWLWPVAGLAATIVAVAIGEGVRVRPGRRPARRWLLALGAVALLVAATGAVVDAFALAGRLSATPGPHRPAILAWLRRDAAMGAVALVVATAAGLTWLAASVRAARVAGVEAAALGIPHPDRRTT